MMLEMTLKVDTMQGMSYLLQLTNVKEGWTCEAFHLFLQHVWLRPLTCILLLKMQGAL